MPPSKPHESHHNGRFWIMRFGVGLVAGVGVLSIGAVGGYAVRHMAAAGHPLVLERVEHVEDTTAALKEGLDEIDSKVDGIVVQQAVQTEILERIEERIP